MRTFESVRRIKDSVQRSLVANQNERATVYRPVARYRFWASHHEDSRDIDECGPHLFPPARSSGAEKWQSRKKKFDPRFTREFEFE